jgi:hypothetical protein
MKQCNESVFAKHVQAKLEKSNGLGSKATWSTKDHLAAMAECVEQDGGVNTLAVLEDTYNISGFQQHLAKAFEKSGHFQRDARTRKESLDSVFAQLAAAAEAKAGAGSAAQA